MTFDGARPSLPEAVPLTLEYGHTRLAGPADRKWIAARFRAACAALGTPVEERGDRLVVRGDG